MIRMIKLSTYSWSLGSNAKRHLQLTAFPESAPKWIVASGLGLAQMLAFGTSLYLLTVLAEPIHEDTGWSLQWIVGGMSVGLLAGAIVAPSVGRWVRRRGGRPALSLSSLLFASGLGLAAVAPSLAIYFTGWCVIGLGMTCGLYDTAFSALGRLYGLEARRAITTVTLWGGFANTVFWSLSGLLVTEFGWRWTCAIYALFHLAIALPIYRWILPPAEPHDDVGPRGRSNPAVLSKTARAAALTLGVLLMAETLVAAAISVHLITILRAFGLSLSAAVGLAALIGPSQVAARLAESRFGGRFHPSSIMIFAVAGMLLGVTFLAAFSAQLTIPAFVLYGMGLGLVSIARRGLPIYLFGPLEAPAIVGQLARPIAVTQAAAPTIGAYLVVQAGGTATLWALGGVLLLSLILAVRLRRLATRMAFETEPL
jgi:MFS family permease